MFTGCARSVRCGGCAVSWATWLQFTVLPGRCVVLCVRCTGPLRSCSPVCSLGALCCVCGVLGPLGFCAPVCCGACAGRRCGVHKRPDGQRLFCSRQGLGTLQARTRSSGQRLFCSKQGIGTVRAGTRPSGRRLFRSRQELGSLRTAAGGCWSWPGRAGRHPWRVVVHLTFLVALLLCVPHPPCCLCPWCVVVLCFFVCCAPFVFVCLLFPTPGVLDLGALWLPPSRPLSLSFVFFFFAPHLSRLFRFFFLLLEYTVHSSTVR